MYSDLLEHITTTQDAALLKQEVEALQASVYKVKENAFQETMQCCVRQWVAEYIEEIMKKNNLAPKEFLDGLLAELKKLQSVQVGLAFEPTRKDIETLRENLKSTFKTPVVLDIQYQPHLLGGITISYQGKYYDFSLSKKLEPMIQEQLQKMTSQVPN